MMSTVGNRSLTVAQCATLACLLEATAPKPGNVHRGADFEDLCFNDFLSSAVAIGPAMEAAREIGVGEAIYRGVRATQDLVGTNTNLGCVLLIAPLAAVDPEKSLVEGISSVLDQLTSEDAEQVYEAIRVASPGGIGKVDEMDVSTSAPASLIAAMKLAADRDLVAKQYTNDFNEVLNFVVPSLELGQSRGWSLTTSIIHTHVRLMSEFPDSLITRKCGSAIAQESSRLARHVLDSGEPEANSYQQALSDLDFWLRCDGHKRNPGTSADLIAAGLYAGLRERRFVSPYR